MRRRWRSQGKSNPCFSLERESCKFFLGRFAIIRHNSTLSITYYEIVRRCVALFANAYSTDIRRVRTRTP